MRPIWYFVGILLLVLGILILGAGVADLLNPPPSRTVLGDLHPSIWWGGLMTVAGGLFFFFHRKRIE